MRAAVFTDNDFAKVNGVTTTLRALVDHAPGDVVPRIYTASDVAADTPHYLALRSIAMPIPFYSEMSMYVPRYREYLRRVVAEGIDVLHLTTPGPMGLTALRIAACTGLPLIGSFHTDLATYTTVLSGSQRLGSLMAQYMRWMYGRCARTLVPSEATRALLVASGVRADRVDLWTRGVDTSHFTPQRRSADLRRRWGTDDRDLVVLYVGRVSLEKGLGIAPEVFARLRAAGIRFRGVFAGDGPYRKTLEAKLPGTVFTGTLDRAAVADVFASADVFMFPSTTDTAGNVVLEAQASGLPVVVSAAGGPKEQMLAGVTGLVCDRADPEGWAAALADLASDGARRRAMAEAARAYAVGRRWSHALAPLFQAYRDVAAVVPQAAEVHHAT